MNEGLRIGLKVLPQQISIGELRASWRLAEEAGFDHVWTNDHFLPVAVPEEEDVHECWCLLSAMAEATSRIRIGSNVTGNSYRNPGMLAKIAATVDHLSDGRLEFGIGSGWAQTEHAMFGLELGSVSERLGRLDEACEIFTGLWTGERFSLDGRFYRIEDAICRPRPVQEPHPPIWIGGRGEKKTLRIVAKHADVWNVLASSLFDGESDLAEDIRLSRVLDEYCRDIDRDPATLRRTALFAHGSDADATRRTVEAYARAGFGDAIIMVSGDDPLRAAEQAATDLLPRLREMEVRASG